MTALLFDIDGTLLSAGGSGGPAMAAACRAAFGESFEPHAYDIPFHGRTDTAITLAYHAAHAAEPTPESLAAFRDGYLGALPGSLAGRDGRVLPGVVPLLDAVTARGDVAVGLLTGNFRQGAAAKLSHYGLIDYFALDRGGYGCDSPRPVRRGRRRRGGAARRVRGDLGPRRHAGGHRLRQERRGEDPRRGDRRGDAG